MKCASCSVESPAGFKFCGACGTPFATAGGSAPAPVPKVEIIHAPSDERRTVTILFADISGFTAMSEKLDPEVVQEIMDRAFERLTAVITGFGGTIDKYIGDAVMALFGAPVALGDDPERAVRAGLGMQKVMGEYGEELKRTRGFGLAMRVGINTGKVIWGRVGGAGEKKFTVMGDAVNLASRLEHAAPIAGVLIGESTQRHVRTRFSLEALDPIQVKGKAELQRVYRVISEVAAPARATMIGPRTPFVGRDEEMAELAVLFSGLVATPPTGAVVTLEASVGTGKSRMVLELRSDADDRGLSTLSARAPAFGQGGPFAPWTDLLQRASGLAGLAPAAARERLRGWIEETAPGSGVDPRWLEELAGEVDAADPEVIRRREQPVQFRSGLLDALITWTWAASKKRPLVLIAEDLHWWPAPSLELLAGVAQVARKSPLLLLATRRPEPTAIDWPTDPADRTIHLGPLDDAALLTLAHGVLGAEVPRGLLLRLNSSSGGNPFFAEEIIQAFIDHGALKTSTQRGGWIWDEARAQQADLPMTVEGVTQARIDALPPRERRVLQMASVAGSTFWEGLIVAMGEVDAHNALLQLIARDLVHSRRSRLAGEKEYTFKHATIQLVAYENSLKRDRVADHRRVADWLEKHAGDASDLDAVLAGHFLKAEEKARALPYLLRAAEEAVRVYASHDDAVVLEQAVDIAEQVNDEPKLGLALRLRGRRRRIAQHVGAESDLRRAMNIGETTGDALAVAEAGRDLGGLFLRKLALPEAQEFAEKTVLAARLAGSRRIEVDAMNMLGSCARRRGDVDEAKKKYGLALEMARLAGESGTAGMLLIAIGNLQLGAGQTPDAVASFEAALKEQLSKENVAILRSNLGAARLVLGDKDAALREIESALEIAEGIGMLAIVAECRIRKGAALAVDDAIAGLREMEAGIGLARSMEAGEALLEGLVRRAELLATSNSADAGAALQEARALAAEKGDRGSLARIDSLAAIPRG